MFRFSTLNISLNLLEKVMLLVTSNCAAVSRIFILTFCRIYHAYSLVIWMVYLSCKPPFAICFSGLPAATAGKVGDPDMRKTCSGGRDALISNGVRRSEPRNLSQVHMSGLTEVGL
ncbi:hypothetical protein XENORESO_015022 [Xenotaenia resolanae]|uniref:Uncharacterized protein n=1 Tax=Xenotaenia resolanae TaxID=208358 RepID=A0ABV0VZR5_9TELE